MSAKQRASIKGRTDDLLDPKRGLDSRSPASASGEKSRNRESAKSRFVKVGIQLDPDLHYALKKLATTNRRKLYEVINEALTEYLNGHKGESR